MDDSHNHRAKQSIRLEYPPHRLPPFTHPTDIRNLEIIGEVTDIRAIQPLKGLHWLCLRGGIGRMNGHVSSSTLDLRPLATLPQLRKLLLVYLHNVTNFSTLRTLRHLTVLRIDRCPHFNDMRVLEGCRHQLQILDIHLTANHIRQLPYFPKLEQLHCPLPKEVTDLEWLPGVMALTTVGTTRHNDTDNNIGMTGMTGMKDTVSKVVSKMVFLDGSIGLYNLTALRRCTAIQNLSLNRCTKIKSLTQISHLIHLQTLDVSRTSVTNLSPLRHCIQLRTLRMDHLHLNASLPKLQAVQILRLKYTCTQAILEQLPISVPLLTRLDISGDLNHRAAPDIISLIPLLECTKLRALDVRFVQGITEPIIKQLLTDSRGFERFRLESCIGRHTQFHFDPWLITDTLVSSYLKARCDIEHTLDLTGAFDLTHLPTGKWMTTAVLRNVYLGGTNVRDVSPLSVLPHLERLDCCDSKGNAAPILNIRSRAGYTTLQRLSLRRCDALRDIDVLAMCPQLTWLDVRECDQIPTTSIRTLMNQTRPAALIVKHDLLQRLRQRRYRVHHNGGRPYEVVIDVRPTHHINPTCETVVTVYAQRPDEETEHITRQFYTYDRTTPIFHKQVAQVFVGRSPYTAWSATTGQHGPAYDGNTMLFRINTNTLQYLFVGHTVFLFEARYPITRFVSRLGNSDVPYPYAVDDVHTEFYELSEQMVCTRFPADTIDAFDTYINRTWEERTIDTFAHFHHIKRLDIGSQQMGCHLVAHPYANYDRLRKKALHTRKQHHMPVTHVNVVATTTTTRRRNTCSRRIRQTTKSALRRRHWYTLPYTTLVDYALTERLISVPSTPQHSYQWYCPEDVVIRYVFVQEIAQPHTGSSTEKSMDSQELEIRCFSTLADTNAFLKRTDALLISKPLLTAPTKNTFRRIRVSNPFQITQHPKWLNHYVIREYRATPPECRRVLTRKQYGELHRTYGRHIGVRGMTVMKV